MPLCRECAPTIAICALLLSPLSTAGLPLQKVTVAASDAPDAVCLDGTRPVYYFRPGSGSGALSFTVFLEGGGWCSGVNQSFGGFDSCLSRSKGDLGSSANYPATMDVGYEGGVAMSDDPQVNPRFHNWNVAYLRYCDGASFTGNKAEPVPTAEGTHIYFRGATIFDAVLKSLASNQRLVAHSAWGPHAAWYPTQHAWWGILRRMVSREILCPSRAAWSPAWHGRTKPRKSSCPAARRAAWQCARSRPVAGRVLPSTLTPSVPWRVQSCGSRQSTPECPALASRAGTTTATHWRTRSRGQPSNASLTQGAPRRDWAHPCHICAGTGLAAAISAPGPDATSAPGPDATSAPGLGSLGPRFPRYRQRRYFANLRSVSGTLSTHIGHSEYSHRVL
jgi:hypothetical protein